MKRPDGWKPPKPTPWYQADTPAEIERQIGPNVVMRRPAPTRNDRAENRAQRRLSRGGADNDARRAVQVLLNRAMGRKAQ